MFYLKLAWRNIWRNKRRTLITLFSIALAVLLSAVTRSMQNGTYGQMIKNSAGLYTGYIQIHSGGYWDDPTLDRSFRMSDSLSRAVQAINGVKRIIPRIESYALAAGQKKSTATQIIGFNPDAERSLSNPEAHLTHGSYITDPSANTVLVSGKLAENLEISIGDTLVLLGQGYHTINATGAYPVQGIVSYGIPELDRGTVFLPVKTAQSFFGAPGRLTAIALMLDDPGNAKNIARTLQATLPSQYEVMPWQELIPELVQAIEADSSSGMIILLVLYMVVGFGILSTILMMTAERKFELGIMLSIGTGRLQLGSMLIMELMMLAFLGIIAGGLGSLPIIWYFHINPIHLTGDAARAMTEYGIEPILPFSTDPSAIVLQGIIVFAFTLVISAYPVCHVYRLKAINALRN